MIENIEDIETVIPGVIKAVNDDGTVDCKAVIRKVAPNGVFDVINPVMPHIPLMKLGGANAEFFFPSKVGDHVLLVAFSRDASRWKREDKDSIIPSSCSGLTLNDLIAIPFVKKTKDGAAKILVTEDGDIVFKPADGRKVISEADFLCKGNVMTSGNVLAKKDVAAKCADLPNGDVTDLPAAIHLSTHFHMSAAGPTDPPKPTPPTDA